MNDHQPAKVPVARQAPPHIDGILTPTGEDILRMVWWSQRGYQHGISTGRPAGRLFSFVMAVTWWPLAPLSLALQAAIVNRRSARYYLSPERDAVLAVNSRRDGWHLEDHMSAHPGSKRGAALRDKVLPVLAAAADAGRVGIGLTAVNKKMAAKYGMELPGLRDVGRGWPRGRRMWRDPQPLHDADDDDAGES